MVDRMGTRLRLPAGARGPIHVYIDGNERLEGRDFTVDDDCVLFREPLRLGREENWWRKLVSSTAGIGFYKHGDLIDVHYVDAAGRQQVASNLSVEPD